MVFLFHEPSINWISRLCSKEDSLSCIVSRKDNLCVFIHKLWHQLYIGRVKQLMPILLLSWNPIAWEWEISAEVLCETHMCNGTVFMHSVALQITTYNIYDIFFMQAVHRWLVRTAGGGLSGPNKSDQRKQVIKAMHVLKFCSTVSL